ncbi:hypothetical protein DFH09DRAFT_1319849 [Mycena vulgaris]|nr:hypothetical protein DFH09DRAFT_1319849 [Mycena vulgaris]
MSNMDTISSLSYIDLKQVPEPFFTEYAVHYGVPLHDGSSSKKLDVETIAAKIVFACGTSSNISLLPSHIVKAIDGRLHIRRRAAADYADPAMHGTFPVERLPDVCDDYSDDEVVERKAMAYNPLGGFIMMEFVYPPVGRRKFPPDEEQLALEAARGHTERLDLPADYLAAMGADLARETDRAVKIYSEAETALKEAVYAHECLRLEVEAERAAWKDLWAYASSVSGKGIVEQCVARVQQRMRGEIPFDEVELAIAEGDLLDPEKKKRRWKTRVVPAGPPPASVLVPAAAPAPTRRLFGGNATSVHPASLFPAPSITSGATFGGNATSFHDGPFLKRRRDSDVDSDSEADDSDCTPSGFAGTRKRARASLASPRAQHLVTTTLKPSNATTPARRSASPRQRPKTPERRSPVLRSAGLSFRWEGLPPLPSPTSSESALLAASP